MENSGLDDYGEMTENFVGHEGVRDDLYIGELTVTNPTGLLYLAATSPPRTPNVNACAPNNAKWSRRSSHSPPEKVARRKGHHTSLEVTVRVKDGRLRR
ncbi:uncharacterized protein STEHIDRAFT_135372 [Stereum hirsutum FP-91666 SS1]|uniref:Uncharacterized protein n=1 Tax=Stereum hirsutum (strain FP-91666) TaxID=721885 RepID=R7S1Q9_STEHR|nr:uncharacterized protein STEHIDRAFT_135372 [Stereum hirsutum FP-91666 SS1]EIM80507.1 hypothetical protein STEHIDRAFT_135372 [Stereum hirsutum FP-91666 SS1]